jgi:hypothetical protein
VEKKITSREKNQNLIKNKKSFKIIIFFAKSFDNILYNMTENRPPEFTLGNKQVASNNLDVSTPNQFEKQNGSKNLLTTPAVVTGASSEVKAPFSLFNPSTWLKSGGRKSNKNNNKKRGGSKKNKSNKKRRSGKKRSNKKR